MWGWRMGWESGFPHPYFTLPTGVAKNLRRARVMATTHWAVWKGTDLHRDLGLGQLHILYSGYPWGGCVDPSAA